MNFKKRREEVGEKKGGFKTYEAKWSGWAWQLPDTRAVNLTQPVPLQCRDLVDSGGGGLSGGSSVGNNLVKDILAADGPAWLDLWSHS